MPDTFSGMDYFGNQGVNFCQKLFDAVLLRRFFLRKCTMIRRAAFLSMMLIACGITTPAWACCWGDGCAPFGPFLFHGLYGATRLGLGPGYPGLLPPRYVCSPGMGLGWTPQPTVVVVPLQPVQVFVSPERLSFTGEVKERRTPVIPAQRADHSDEIARSRALYPQGIPAVDSVWYPGREPQRLK